MGNHRGLPLRFGCGSAALRNHDPFRMTYMKGKINISREYCKGCELCMFFCPQKIISLSSELNTHGYLTAVCLNSEGCTGCAVCATVCPEVAIEVYRG